MSKFEDVGYYNNSTYRENVPAFQAVKAVEESSYSYDQEVVEMSSKSYRRTSRSEKKMTERMVEYRKTETERVTKTGSWRSQSMDGLSSGEEFRRTIQTFVSEQKKMHIIRASGVDDHGKDLVTMEVVVIVIAMVIVVVNIGSRLEGGSGSKVSGSYLALSN
ncbi:unnamed protein product [Arabidopsis thaliana]|uniref:(thale cress) hypothetical protein n=1 Tax=Arabidopsis thaliana TaxID=3702 RepID=A0A7G2DUH5_ARATH|nr:unnamed protein product [Arabidopsis thaliana]